ncbi:MAG TPA: hypothetical protein VGN96_00275 [Roseococcus sp.]|jgi:hypothetical protein|nr:hypothetical protein [Roseococcus sp.]
MPTGFIAPCSLGWNTRDPISAMKPGFAPIFDNFVVEGGLPRVRRGWRVWATGLPGRVDGLLPWSAPTSRLFASSGAGIYEVTTPGAVGAAVVSGLTNARWSSIQFSASGGQFLFAFNGVDTPRTFNGTAWATWAGTGVTPVAWAGASNGRLFVGHPGALSFWYGAAGAIGGTFTEFPLQGVAQRGGGVVAMATLSFDGGAGPQTLTVFLTSEEEAIVYGGTDPSSASSWQLVGRWRIPRLLGAPHRCVVGYGGDALAITESGLLPLSGLRTGEDVGRVMERVGPTRRIAPTWREIAAVRGGFSGWGVTPIFRLGLVVVNAPWTATAAQQIVVSEGGAVSRWGNVPAAVWAEALEGRTFFGDATSGGRVMLYGEDLTDAGLGIRSEGLSAYSAMGAAGRMKRSQLVQAILNDVIAVDRTQRVLVDWATPAPELDATGPTAVAPPVPPLTGGGSFLVWGVGLWGVGLWGGTGGVSRAWRTGSAQGHAMAVHLRMISGQSRPGWLGSNIVYEVGGPVR